jgi:DNA-binding beta-propeller fold protein YncE
MKTFFFLSIAAAGGLLMQEAGQQRTAREQVGRQADGSFLLNSGWSLRPAGDQIPVDTFPMSTAVSKNGKFVLVLNGGYNPPSISVIDAAAKRELERTPLPDCWLGLTLAPKGDFLYVGGGSRAEVYELSFDEGTGKLAPVRKFAAAEGGGAPNSPSPTAEQGAPAKPVAFVGDVALSPDAHLLYAADLYNDSIVVINLQSGQVIGRWKTGRRPYRLVVSPGGKQVIASSWADGALYQHNAETGARFARTPVGPHATDVLWIDKPFSREGGASFIGRIFVAAANTNSVYSFGVGKDGQLTRLESLNVSLTPMHPLGMTPSALGVNAEGTRLYVACSDANAVAAADISGQNSRVLGFIPTGWYPTAVRVLASNQLVILNGKGLGSKPNPHGPNPALRPAPVYQGTSTAQVEYVGRIQTGTAALLPVPEEAELPAMTEVVRKNSPYRDEIIYGPIDDEQVAYFAKTEGHESPIKHILYVIKENRTYDQVLGDVEKGNGDKSLTLFGEKITPNLHRLAREFILYDNFYENADVSADGHNWASAAIAPDYTVKLWPSEYAHRKPNYDFEGGEPANTPPAGYIWGNALQAGVTVRDYGEWVTNVPLKAVKGPQQIASVRDPVLKPYVDMNFRSFDLEYADVDRAKEFIREWKEFDAKNEAPGLIILRLGNDHTQGTKPAALTPLSYNADNDYAVGMVVDALSHSKLWASTAMFVIEDDAQNGPDHVDSHRAPVFVISPYTRRGLVDSAMYNQTSVLRSIELILGIRPMTHFDAAARPMFGSFSREADLRPYNVQSPTASLTDRNPPNGAGAQKSARMDFSEADKIDDDELNDVLWRAIKGSEPPVPTRSAFSR